MKTFDPTKPATTVDGREAEFVRSIHHPFYPLLFVIKERNGSQWPTACTTTGRSNINVETGHDLINIPEKRVVDVWISVYDNGEYSAHLSEAAAARCNYSTSAKRIACIHKQIEIEVP